MERSVFCSQWVVVMQKGDPSAWRSLRKVGLKRARKAVYFLRDLPFGQTVLFLQLACSCAFLGNERRVLPWPPMVKYETRCCPIALHFPQPSNKRGRKSGEQCIFDLTAI